MANKFTSFFSSLFSFIEDQFKSFWSGPGGDITKQAIANALKEVGSQGLQLLLQAAKHQIAGQKVLTSSDWDRVATNLQGYAMANAIPVTESLLDYIIGNAVKSNG